MAKEKTEITREIPLKHHTGTVWGAVVPDEPEGFVEDMSFGVDAKDGRWAPFQCYFKRRVAGGNGRSVELRFFDRSDRPYLPHEGENLCLRVTSPAK